MENSKFAYTILTLNYSIRFVYEDLTLKTLIVIIYGMGTKQIKPEDATFKELISDILPDGYSLNIEYDHGNGKIRISSSLHNSIGGYGYSIKEALIDFQIRIFLYAEFSYFGFWTGYINWLDCVKGRKNVI